MELLFPGTRVILERRKRADSDAVLEAEKVQEEPQKPENERFVVPFREGYALHSRTSRKTEWTLVAVYSSAGVDLKDPSFKNPPEKKYANTRVVPLYSSRLNRLTEALILPRLFPGARKIQREVRWGNSQFDFFIEDAGGKGHFLEVKGCTLVAHGVAMFPDAPSSRAVRHLRELAEVAKAGYGAHVVFVLTHGPVKRFIPNLHTDPEFAVTLSTVAPWIQIHTAEIAADSEGQAWVAGTDFPVELSHGGLAEQDRGSYLVSLFLPAGAALEVGALGWIDFPPGWYVYAGSARRGLKARIARHLRIGGNLLKGNLSKGNLSSRVQRKKLHWHIDYLAEAATYAKGYPIASYQNLECELARELAEIGGVPVEGFGSTDCRCRSHLYWFPMVGVSENERMGNPGPAPFILTPDLIKDRPMGLAGSKKDRIDGIPLEVDRSDIFLPGTAKANARLLEGSGGGVPLYKSNPVPLETDPRFVDLLLRFRHVEAFKSGAKIVAG